MLDHAVSDGTIAAPMLRPVRPVGVTGQIGAERQNPTNAHPGGTPSGQACSRVVLGSAGHLERLQTSRRRKKNSKWRLEELGFEEDKK